MFFLFLILFFTHAVTSTLLTDSWVRAPASLPNLNSSPPRNAHYTVFSRDPIDMQRCTQTETFLKNLYGEGNVEQDRNGNELISWRITSTNSETTAQLKNHAGIRLVIPEGQQKGSPLVRRENKLYMGGPPDSDSDDARQKTREFLDTKVDKSVPIFQTEYRGHIMLWGNLALDDAAKAEVENHPGIKGPLLEDLQGKPNRVVSNKDWSEAPRELYRILKKKSAILRRALAWKKQEKAPKDLVMDSQSPGTDLSKMNDFVYEQKAGDGVFIYVVDEGVAVDVKNSDKEGEFRVDKRDVLQSLRSKNGNQNPYTDESPSSHGTAVASKAAGKRFGVGKGANIVPAKLTRYFDDFLNLLWTVVEDIEDTDRGHKSVIVMSFGWGADKAERSQYWQWSEPAFNKLFDMGVPIVVAAGNEAPGTPDIDAMPAVFEGPNTPLINVGAATLAGDRASFSQAGSQLTIYAPGDKVEGQMKEDGKSESMSGTSYAAPAVAGLLATYLAYDEPPWDKTKQGKERVQAIKDYVRSDQSSWERNSGNGVKIIWNGATKEAHDGAGSIQCTSKKRGECSISLPPASSQAPAPSPAPSPPPQPSSPAPTKALSILIKNFGAIGPVSNSWLFFTPTVGQSALCNQNTPLVAEYQLKGPAFEDPTLITNPPYPGGTYKLVLYGEDCEYKNNGENPGRLWCPSVQGGISCTEEPARTKGQGDTRMCEAGPLFGGPVAQHPVVYCEW